MEANYSFSEFDIDIRNNSYPVKLSNGQTIYIKRNESSIVMVYVRDEDKHFKKVVSVNKFADKEAVKECLDCYSENIKMPLLTDFKCVRAYDDACDSLMEEIASAILNESFDKIAAQTETGKTYEKFKDEIEGMKSIDIEMYNNYITSVYYCCKNEEDDDDFPLTDYSFGYEMVRALLYFFTQKYPNNPKLEEIKKGFIEKWDNYDDEDY